ncbi:glycosyltransferase [Arthrobacter sp.]|uniref:glycosyltransferase family 2 protein n=1 Tax=Arthrobacter sp. TaxID=1667 RepID=UPI00258268FF|nr:glycosyltransferase [Arthrobacter sp.]
MENRSPAPVLLDMVIAVHTPDRPVGRAVASLIEGGLPVDAQEPGRLRITVVCHNADPREIEEQVRPEHRSQVRFVSHQDGIRSPAGPFNRGIAEADATWVGIMGSDDTVEPGALAAWVDVAEADGADALIAPMGHAGGGPVRTPVVRRGRHRDLDPVADRLSYRTAPLGVLRLAVVRGLGLEFPTKYATGEDQSFSARLWFSGARISYGRGLPRYLVHDDAQLRVTHTPRSITEDLAFATDLVQTDWFLGLPARSREALVTKLIRVHLFGHVWLRAQAGTWTAADAAEAAVAARILLFAAPRAARPLSLADRALLDAVARGEERSEVMARLSEARRKFSHPRALLPRSLSQVLQREAPLRFMIASALL